MPWQLIYTSAPRGLLSGQSGFCTVARSADLREALVQRLEQISSYHYLRVAEAATANRNPTISAFRLLDLRGAKYYVLTRIQPCGLDFTARTNHLAHHLIFQPDELAKLPSPAAILRYWPDWKASWQGEPRVLEEVDAASFAAAVKNFLPAHTWARLTGDGGRAAGLLESECVRGCYLLCPPGSEEQVLEMYCETLQLLNFNGQFPLRPWRHTFTAFLQAEDNPNDFQWRGCQESTPAYKQALTRSAPMIALRSVRVPGNSLVKLAREEPKPPPPPAPPATPRPPPYDPPPRSALKTLPRDQFARGLSAPPPMNDRVNRKKSASADKPLFLHRAIVVSPATLTGLGIFLAVVVTLLVIKLHWANPPPEMVTSAPPAPKPRTKSEPPPQKPPPTVAVPDAKQLDRLLDGGPTFILAVANLNAFTLPVDSIGFFQNLLHCYDRQDPGGLPNDIHLEADTNHWEFSPGALMSVKEWKSNIRQFSASLGVSECVFDYSEWIAGKGTSLTVHDNFDSATQALSFHFASSSNNLYPFRLLIVSEKNPPAPLNLPLEFAQTNRVGLLASLKGAFIFLGGRQLQYQPLVKSASQPSQYLYKNWLANDLPAPGHELDFEETRLRLQARSQALSNELSGLFAPLARPLGKIAGSTNSELVSFWSFSGSTNLTPVFFLEYLGELKKSAPSNSWIKKWHPSGDDEEPEDVSVKFQDLYNHWSTNQFTNQPSLLVTNGNGEATNYFLDTWNRLKDLKTRQDHLAKVQKQLFDLDHAHVGLCIIGPNQSGPGLEMIRFGGP
jgi:hypothetical protein